MLVIICAGSGRKAFQILGVELLGRIHLSADVFDRYFSDVDALSLQGDIEMHISLRPDKLFFLCDISHHAEGYGYSVSRREVQLITSLQICGRARSLIFHLYYGEYHRVLFIINDSTG